MSHVTNKQKKAAENKVNIEMQTSAVVAEISVSPAPVPNTDLKSLAEDHYRNSPDLPDLFLR